MIEERPEAITPRKSQCLMRSFVCESVIGPYSFENDDGMITNFFSPAIEEHDLENIWFQQYGITCHTT